MSRIGKQPVKLLSGVKVSQSKEQGRTHVKVEGPKGKLAFAFRTDVSFDIDDETVTITRAGDSKFERAYHGTARALVANMVTGVSAGFTKTLEIEGVGYNAKVGGKKLTLQIGFCHPIEMTIPEGVTLETPNPTTIVISGADKQIVGEFAAQIRKIRPPEPYKGKGIRYRGEQILRKAGKAFGSGD